MNHFDYDLRSIQEVRDLVRMGEIATEKISTYTEDQINKIVVNMVRVAAEHAVELAEMAVEETGFGKVEDKTYKNHMASTLLYEAIKDMKTVGVIRQDMANKVIEIAEPVGLLMGIVPSTNPTSTAIFKSIVAVKSRNAIIFSPHPAAEKCTSKAAQLMHDAAVEAGAPEHIVGSVSMPSAKATDELMHCPEVKMIIATGGPGMVKAAYSAGKPALGVGAGNSPAYIERTANVAQAVRNIIASKTFDYGTICASEQSIIAEECNRDAVIQEFKKQGAYFMTAEETQRVCQLLFKNGHNMNAKFVGRSPLKIAEAAGISVPSTTTVLIGEQHGVGEGYPLSYEKLTTVLGFYTVKDWHEACELSIKLLQNGIGHTMSIHTEDENIVREFSAKPASRILVNTGSSQGGTGASTGLIPSFTLGCGTWGGSSVSENVTPMHLINTKKVAYGLRDCRTLAENDPLFNYPELAKYYGASQGTCEPLSPSPATSRPASTPMPVQMNQFGSPDSFSKMAMPLSSGDGCCSQTPVESGCCSQTSMESGSGCCTAIGVDSGEGSLTQDQLQDMIVELAKTMRGER